MSAEPSANAWLLDRPEALAGLFYPRPDFAEDTPANSHELSIPVAEGVVVGARCHLADSEATTLLFFHGNGEIVR
ncbi:MAG TPA: alpha/beta hydrolase, partial [Candidatus Competibacter sp.]|nr:alpha/beta hydrolase [Candidatus Competibacter sp.]